MKRNGWVLFFSALLAGSLFVSCGTSQTAAEKQQAALRIKQKVESFHFTFQATFANPMGFRQIHLTSDYGLTVSKDTVTAFLPYFGRAYSAPMDPTEGGTKFTSTDFEYLIEAGKRPGNWKVTIKTHDTRREILLFLDIWENGSAQLSVNDPDRQSISFEGNIDPAK